MPDNTDNSNQITQNAMLPARVDLDGERVDQVPIPDQIAADRYAASNAAKRGRKFPVKFVKLIPPGGC